MWEEIMMTNVECEASTGDLTGDGIIDISDAAILMSHFEKEGAVGDLNCDGVVNQADVDVMLANWTNAPKEEEPEVQEEVVTPPSEPLPAVLPSTGSDPGVMALLVLIALVSVALIGLLVDGAGGIVTKMRRKK